MNEKKILANYCLGCKAKPCSTGCPLGNDIPEFIKNIKEDNYENAYKILSKTTVLQSICGRICPHISQCMGKCVRGIKSEPVSIGELEYYVGDKAIDNNYEMHDLEIKESEKSQNAKKRVAVIGGGPAGLTCAAFLARYGFNVTIFEKYDELGGLLRYGIPEFRLPNELLDKAINKIVNLGINVKYKKELGKNLKLDDLNNEFDAIFIAIGANIPCKMGILGEDLTGVYGGNSLLEKHAHPDYKNKNVAIIGGGNVAMDCARTINKMGAKSVTVIYRRSEEQMPAEKKEIEEAKNEGVKFLFQTNVLQILSNNQKSNYVKKIECIKTKLIQKQGETRLSPVDIDGSNYVLDMDYVIMAIGSKPEENIIKSLNLDITKKGYIKVNENYQTSKNNIFAGGDLVGEKATVAYAAKTGRLVAEYIKENI